MSEHVTRPRPTGPLAWLSRRRRDRLAPVVLLLLALGTTGLAYAVLSPTAEVQAATGASSATIEQGRQLYLKNCATCHGLSVQGTSDGPTLIGVGAAAVDFQVETGRMPAQQLGVQIEDKPNIFSDEEIAAMAAYIASLAPGPAVPTEEQLDYSDADAAEGGAIYRTNCAMCHNYAGSGGALTQGKYAPSLRGVTPEHIYEAMLTGPQSMPVFNDDNLSAEEKQDVIAFLKELEEQPRPGGLELGRVGPVSEGAVSWVVGIGALVAAAVWLGAKAR